MNPKNSETPTNLYCTSHWATLILGSRQSDRDTSSSFERPAKLATSNFFRSGTIHRIKIRCETKVMAIASLWFMKPVIQVTFRQSGYVE